jgi:hypothetical protein
LALFSRAIDGKLCGCDRIALRVRDVARNGHATDRVNARPK